MDRYEFLAELHRIIKPRRYLEIGVQTGASLTLAREAETAVGVDPDLGHLTHDCTFATLVETTSDDFFAAEPDFTGPDGESWLDLVFIDGLHHAEQVWKDFYNAAEVGHPGTVYVFDDMLPRNQLEAAREMCPGDWTGDVWKVYTTLEKMKGMVSTLLVDTFPTGIMVSRGDVNTQLMRDMTSDLTDLFQRDIWEVPEWMLTRSPARVFQPGEVLDVVTSWKG